MHLTPSPALASHPRPVSQEPALDRSELRAQMVLMSWQVVRLALQVVGDSSGQLKRLRMSQH